MRRRARLGGQALLAQLLPGRAEFGGIVTNLTREMELAGVKVRARAPWSTRALVDELRAGCGDRRHRRQAASPARSKVIEDRRMWSMPGR